MVIMGLGATLPNHIPAYKSEFAFQNLLLFFVKFKVPIHQGVAYVLVHPIILMLLSSSIHPSTMW